MIDEEILQAAIYRIEWMYYELHAISAMVLLVFYKIYIKGK